MNWQMFSWVGYVSVGLWLCVPLLWLLHEVLRPRRWFAHVALALGVAALALATVNSKTHVNRIQIDRSEQIVAHQAKIAAARKAAEEQRADEVANVTFAEDAAGDRLDKAGMDDADLAYFRSFEDDTPPEWKKQKQKRDTSAGDDTSDLESMIGGGEKREGLETEALPMEEAVDPVIMSEADKQKADRYDALNLNATRIILALAFLFVVVDYIRRLNKVDERYLPLPVPSRWADGLTPRAAITARRFASTDALLDELYTIARRGETFVLMTEDAILAARATTKLPRLPRGLWPIEALNVSADGMWNDEFVFETLWFGRNCFVVDSHDRGRAMLDRFIELLTQRRGTRARTRQTVHLLWDLQEPVSAHTQACFEKLGSATGFRLILIQRQGGQS